MGIFVNFFGAVALIAMVILTFVWGLRIKIHVVPQEERLIIYRWGRFQRIAGPGPVWIMHRLDSVARTITVRDQDRNFPVSGLFSFDIPFGYTLNLWYRYDPVAAAWGDDELLLELAQHGEDERYAQIAVKLREALVRAIMTVQQELAVTLQKTSASEQTTERKLSIIDKLMMIVPGLPTCERILELAQDELAQVLPGIGVILNRNHPIAVVHLEISDDLISSFSRGRITELLRSSYQSLSEAELAHRVAMIEGFVDGHSFEGGQFANVQPELRLGRDGAEVRQKARPQPSSQTSSRSNRIDESARELQEANRVDDVGARETIDARSSEPRQPDWELSPRDLEVLKLVPPMPQNNGRRRRAG